MENHADDGRGRFSVDFLLFQWGRNSREAFRQAEDRKVNRDKGAKALGDETNTRVFVTVVNFFPSEKPLITHCVYRYAFRKYRIPTN